jgi:hypothetical protein
MHRFIRFQTEVRSPQTGLPLGLFRASVKLRADFELPSYMDEMLEESLEWFNDNLIVPRLGSQRGRPIFWFRTEADDCLAQIWNLVALFNEEGLYVEQRTTLRPGHIVYQDAHQIAAIPNKR